MLVLVILILLKISSLLTFYLGKLLWLWTNYNFLFSYCFKWWTGCIIFIFLFHYSSDNCNLANSGEKHADTKNLLDARLRVILESVRLSYLLEREENNWDTNSNWEDILSLGEQQRLGMVSESNFWKILDFVKLLKYFVAHSIGKHLSSLKDDIYFLFMISVLVF